jgi:hypothetical protein
MLQAWFSAWRHQPQGLHTMNETPGRLLATGKVAKVFEWGSRIVKLYRLLEIVHA